MKTWALQVYVPTTYKGPSDAAQLGTVYLAYVPSDLVDTLSQAVKTKTSPFYTGVNNIPAAKQLAERVNAGYPITSVPGPGPNTGGGSGGDSGNGGDNGGSGGNDGKVRQDAIIGVVSALGAIALLVLVFLVYRSMKRRQQLAHRRLSDPPADAGFIGARPDGREFDQDSVGAPRRRSFYYAEDSLRGYQGDRQEEVQFDSRAQGVNQMGQISQRRNVLPATISAPILRESSMNW